MPYTVRAVSMVADPALAVEEQTARVQQLLQLINDPAQTALRLAAMQTSDLLAYGAMVSPDGLQLITISMWKSKAVYAQFPQITLDAEWTMVVSAI